MLTAVEAWGFMVFPSLKLLQKTAWLFGRKEKQRCSFLSNHCARTGFSATAENRSLFLLYLLYYFQKMRLLHICVLGEEKRQEA